MAAKKVYSEGWIRFASFFGGPLAGTYLMSKNFEIFGKKDLALRTLLLGLTGTALLFLAVALTPAQIIDKIPSIVLPVLYTAVISGLVFKFQGKELSNFLSKGGKKYSGWRVIGISILSALVTLASFFVILLLLQT